MCPTVTSRRPGFARASDTPQPIGALLALDRAALHSRAFVRRGSEALPSTIGSNLAHTSRQILEVSRV